MFLTACRKPGAAAWPCTLPELRVRSGDGLRSGLGDRWDCINALSPELIGPQCADAAKRVSSPASLHAVMDSGGCSWAIFDPVMRQGFPADKMSL